MKKKENTPFEDENNEVDGVDLNQIELSEIPDSTLSMRRLPWSLWGLAILFFFGGSFLLANLITKKIFSKYIEGYWWEYFIVSIMYTIGIIVFFCGKIEVVCFDKDKMIMSHNKWILCYKWKGIEFSLTDIANICLQREGVTNGYEDTIHYKVSVELKNGLPLRILETKSRHRAIEKATEIKNFLGFTTGLQIKDISTF
jgi:hypothetical protein